MPRRKPYVQPAAPTPQQPCIQRAPTIAKLSMHDMIKSLTACSSADDARAVCSSIHEAPSTEQPGLWARYEEHVHRDMHVGLGPLDAPAWSLTGQPGLHTDNDDLAEIPLWPLPAASWIGGGRPAPEPHPNFRTVHQHPPATSAHSVIDFGDIDDLCSVWSDDGTVAHVFSAQDGRHARNRGAVSPGQQANHPADRRRPERGTRAGQQADRRRSPDRRAPPPGGHGATSTRHQHTAGTAPTPERDAGRRGMVAWLPNAPPGNTPTPRVATAQGSRFATSYDASIRTSSDTHAALPRRCAMR